MSAPTGHLRPKSKPLDELLADRREEVRRSMEAEAEWLGAPPRPAINWPRVAIEFLVIVALVVIALGGAR